MDNLPTSIFVKDEHLRFVFSNKGHCDLIGKPESELLGKSDSDFYSEEESRGFIANDRRVIDPEGWRADWLSPAGQKR